LPHPEVLIEQIDCLLKAPQENYQLKYRISIFDNHFYLLKCKLVVEIKLSEKTKKQNKDKKFNKIFLILAILELLIGIIGIVINL
jgi:hypothetical protein